MAKKNENPDPERSARAKAAHAAKRAQREQEQRERDVEDARKYRELMEAQKTPDVQVQDVTIQPQSAGRVPTENVYGGPQAEVVEEAQEERYATPAVVPIVEVPFGTPNPSRTPSSKSDEVKAAEDLLAREQARLANIEANSPEREVRSDPQGDVTVHFVEDGFTALGKVWEKGKTLTLARGSDDWNETLDKKGRSWTEESADEQLDRRGKVYFLPGPANKTAVGVVTDEEEQRAIMSSDPDDLLRLKKRAARQAKPRMPLSR
jgi:hypothetical protein